MASSSKLPSTDLFRTAKNDFNGVALHILKSSRVNISIIDAQAIFFQKANSFQRELNGMKHSKTTVLSLFTRNCCCYGVLLWASLVLQISVETCIEFRRPFVDEIVVSCWMER